MPSLRFDGQVAIVTGAGGGIGYAIARELAARGARLLVNDYGGDMYGKAGDVSRAEQVAAELRELGAEAVADGTPVGTFDAARTIVGAAKQAFGRVDILVNNAGIALPGRITDYSERRLETVFQTNLFGPYALIREVWPLMCEQRYGRILNTASNAAFGMGANAPYATTKAGLVGLTLDAGMEGKPLGIHVNAMMPTALTRLIEGIPDADFVAWFRRSFPAEKVALSVLPLLGRDCAVTGRIYAAGGGRIARVAFTEGRGWVDPNVTPERAAEHIAQIEDMTDAVVLDDQQQSMALFNVHFPFSSDGNGPALNMEHAAEVTRGRQQP